MLREQRLNHFFDIKREKKNNKNYGKFRKNVISLIFTKRLFFKTGNKKKGNNNKWKKRSRRKIF